MPYADPAQQRLADARWRARHRELKRSINRTWARANKVLHAAHQRAHSRRKRQRILDRCGGRCVYCGADSRLTIDHKMPLSRGGLDIDANKVAACFPCNRRKYRKTCSEFVAQLRAERGDEPLWLLHDNPLALEDEESTLTLRP